MDEPIKRFKDDNELRQCMLWWKERLGLHDWAIHVELVDQLFDEDGETELAGRNEFQVLHKTALIKISRLEDGESVEDSLVKVRHEKTLVHELLHCLYNWMEPPYTMEGKYFDAMEHQRMEQLARSLVCVKYNLPLTWWDNTDFLSARGGATHEDSSPK